jgi:hypothetical protein
MEKDLNDLMSQADIDLLPDIFVRYTVMHLLNRYMIVKLDGSDFPDC